MIISTSLKNDISEYANKMAPRESCGFIIDEEHEYKLIKTENIAKEINMFEISPIDYLNINSNYNIKYIYHNHLDNYFDFSELDKKISDIICIDLLLYILKLDRFKIFRYKTREELWLK